MLRRIAGGLHALALMACLTVALAPAQGHAQAGKSAAVLRSVTGTVFQQPTGGQVRVVPAGTELFVGDTVGTQKGAFALVVFGDGSRVALRPESAMAIRGFSFKSDDPVNDQVSMQLLKGWLRMVSGQIGKRGDTAAVELKANDTTIGIRGTDFAVRICEAECDPGSESDYEGVLPQSGRLGRVLASEQPLRRLRDGTATLDAAIDAPLFLGDVLVAGEVEAVIGLDDGSRLVLGPGTRVALRAEEDEQGRRAIRLDLIDGVMRVATPPQTRARLYGLLIQAGNLLGLRQNTALDISCETPSASSLYPCEVAQVEVRDGLADVLTATGLRTLRGGSRSRLADPDLRPGSGASATPIAAPASIAMGCGPGEHDLRLPAIAAPRVAPLQDDAPPVADASAGATLQAAQLGASPGRRALFDPRDIAPEGVRPRGAVERPQTGVYAAVFEGMIEMRNPSGQILIPAGQGGFSPPVTTVPPRLLPVAPRFMERDRELERSRLTPGECPR